MNYNVLSELKDIKKEILALKNTTTLTATAIKIKESNHSLSYTFNIDTFGGIYDKDYYYVIKITNPSGGGFFSTIYQRGTVFGHRYLSIRKCFNTGNNTDHTYQVMCRSLNPSDANTVFGGGSVNYTYNIKILTTADCTITITKTRY